MTLGPAWEGTGGRAALEEKPCVAHSVAVWLPLTMVWLHRQLKHVEGFSSLVLARTTENLDRFPWVPLVPTPGASRRLFLGALRSLGIRRPAAVHEEAIRRLRPLILHSHFGNTAWNDLVLAARHGLRHVVTFYGVDVNGLPSRQPVWRRRYRELFASADLFLCEGPHMARSLVGLGCPPGKVRVQRLGVEVERIPCRPRVIGADGVIKVLIAASFREKKGIPYALEAIGILKRRHPNIQVTIIGDAGRGDRAEKRKILRAIGRCGLGGVTRLLGYQPHERLMEEAYGHHLFISPSVTASDGDTEGGAPVAILEMAASGMPVLSTWHCDIPQIVRHGVTGMLSPERDASSLAENADMILRTPGLMGRMGRAGHELVRKDHDVRKLARGLERLYEGLLAAPSGRFLQCASS